MGEDSLAQKIRLESWMSDLSPKLRDVPLIYLAIPGSHDSMTYGITRSSTIAPDAEPVLKRLYPIFRGTILRWTVTQSTDTWQQLLLGIRYLDLRIATKVGEENFYFTHGLYAEEISKALLQVKDFVDSHPGEVVILDCQHFYGFTLQDHQRLAQYLIDLYGPRLVSRHIDTQSVTINTLAKLKKQVIIVYRDQSMYSRSEFWAGQMLPSPWPQRDSTSRLLAFLRHVRRGPAAGFVHQAVLTPTPLFIVLRFISSLREKCAIPVKDEVLPALRELRPGRPDTADIASPAPVNVVIADFIEMDDAVFPETIIRLNMKL